MQGGLYLMIRAGYDWTKSILLFGQHSVVPEATLQTSHQFKDQAQKRAIQIMAA